jgi:succinate dehydrogenase/fumarate reductase flavoprotein subunit
MSDVSNPGLRLPFREGDAPADTADLLVIGYGVSGACAALEARGLGGDVLVLERASAGGGASALSAGLFYLGGGTPLQQAAGYEDSADNMYRFMIASMGTENADLARRFCDGAAAHFDWLEAQGVPFERSYFAGKAVSLQTTHGLMSTGNEKVWPFREVATPVPRGHQATTQGNGAGAAAMAALLARCEVAGVRAQYDSQVLALLVDDAGRVRGVRARRFGETRDYHARRGVMIATGGFAMNVEMVRQNVPLLSATSEPLGTPNTLGSGIVLGVAAGAATDAMDGVIATASFYPPGQLIKGIVVNNLGRRFVAEDSYHGRTASFIMEQPGQKAYLIVDAEVFAYPENPGANHTLVDGFESIAEMEQRLGTPQGSLTDTLGRYNAHAAKGEDPDFHKHPDWLKPLDKGPWAAFDISFDRSTYRFMTLGGLRINPDAEVLGANGAPIPGLYAAGACTAHISRSGKSYASGMSLGPGSFFGRMAGRSAMA